MKLHRIQILTLSAIAGYAFALNGNYYRYFFLDAGYPGLMPVLMAVFFIASELALWSFSSQKNIVSIALKYGLVIFSIFATLSSQYSSTSEKITTSAQEVYEKIDNSGEIERYEEQIRIQDQRIEDIFEERKTKSYYGLTDDELKYAQDQKAKYEQLLVDLRTENKQEIQEVYQASNIYGWLAEDLPMILSSGLNEEFLRVIFQLFSSFILAAIAPVSISIIRNTAKPKQPEKIVNSEPVAQPEEIPEQPEAVEPVVISEPEPEAEPDPEREDIVKMLLYYYPGKPIMTPERASEIFCGWHKEGHKNIKPYSIAQCREVYDEIISRGLDGEDKNKIMEVMR